MLSVVLLAAATPTQCPQNQRSDYAASTHWTSYKVQPGDTPASVALKFYGKESEAHVIIAVNKTKMMPDGLLFKTGETLVIPPHGKPWKYDVGKYRNWHDW
jgi:nucleoid-associated protein YgaU